MSRYYCCVVLFFIFCGAMSRKVLFVWENIFNFVVSSVFHCRRQTYRKCFSRSYYENVEVFGMKG